MSYDKPGLRNRLKNEIVAGSKGGKPGQWSARKAQMLAQRYEAAGGGYTGPKSGAQKSLSKWTSEEWRTSDRKPAIRKGGTTRYLPDKAWSKLSASEKAATNAKKVQGSKAGKQFVPNTKPAASARRSAVKSPTRKAG